MVFTSLGVIIRSTIPSFLNNVDRSPLEDAEKISLKNQVRFLRALYHHELFRFYGALVIGDKELDPLLYDEIKRESLETTVRWIANEFKELIPPRHDTKISEGELGNQHVLSKDIGILFNCIASQS